MQHLDELHLTERSADKGRMDERSGVDELEPTEQGKGRAKCSDESKITNFDNADDLDERNQIDVEQARGRQSQRGRKKVERASGVDKLTRRAEVHGPREELARGAGAENQ